MPCVAQSEAPLTTVVIAPSEATLSSELEATVIELLERLEVRVRVEHVSAIDPAVVLRPPTVLDASQARVWIDATDPQRATLYVVDASWSRVLVRHFARTTEGDAVLVEAVAHTVEAAVEALLEGGVIGVARTEMVGASTEPQRLGNQEGPPTAEVPAVDASPGWRLRLGAGLGYEVAGYSDQAPVSHGPGLLLMAEALVGDLRIGVWLGGQVQLPLLAEAAGVTLELDVVALHASFVVGWQASSSVALELAVGVRGLVASVGARASNPSIVPAPPETLTFGAVRAVAAARIDLAPPLGLLIGAGVEGEFADNHFYAEGAMGPVDVLVPWRAHPMGLALFTMDTEWLGSASLPPAPLREPTEIVPTP